MSKASKSSEQPEQIVLDWERIHHDCDALARKLAGQKNEWKGIIAVARGGLVPAALISRLLDMKLVETICMSSYNRTQGKMLEMIKEVENIGDGRGWLIIDDLSDTGNTFRTLRAKLPAAHYACLYVKPMGKDLPDTWVGAFEQNCWLHFPWELQAGFNTEKYEMY